MSHTVYANGRSVCTKGTPDAAKNLPPDVCLTPDKKPFPAPNFIGTSELGSGKTNRTLIAGQPIWTAHGKLDASPSQPAHPGVDGGLVSGTYIDLASPTSWSPNVLFEGGGAVRMLDTTLQNNGNCTGMVMPAALAVSLATKEMNAATAVNENKEEADEDAPSIQHGDDAQEAVIKQAHTDALAQIDQAIEQLTNAKTNPDPLVEKYFGIDGTSADDIKNLDKLIDNFESMRDDMADIQYEVEDEPIKEGEPNTVAYVYTLPLVNGVGDVHLNFPMFSNISENARAGTVVHEMAHYSFGADDVAYDWEDDWDTLTTKQQMNNADSYGEFAAEASRTP